METGTSKGFYIFVAAIIMGIMVVIATGMGDIVSSLVGNIMNQVENNNQSVISKIESAPPVKEHTLEPRYPALGGIYATFFDNPELRTLGVTDDRHGFNEAIYAAEIEAGNQEDVYVEYAVYDDKGYLVERFVYGDRDKATVVVVNDERQLPKGAEYGVIQGGYAIGSGSVRYLRHQSGNDTGQLFIVGTDEGVETADRIHKNPKG